MYIGLHVKYTLLLSDFIETWLFLTGLQKIIKYKILRNSVRWETSCSMRTGRQIDMTKLIVAFHNFANPSQFFSLESFFYWSVEKLLMQEAQHCTIQLKVMLKWFMSI
jgi:hypothetical protein